MVERKEPATKREMLDAIRDSRAQLEDTLGELAPEQMLQARVEGEWSVKDILAHIVDWEQRMVRWVAESLRGETPVMPAVGMTWADIDKLNEQTYLQNRDRALDDVLGAFHDSHQQAVQCVEAAPEDSLLNPEAFAWTKGDALWILVAANTWWHYAEHQESIQNWLASV